MTTHPAKFHSKVLTGQSRDLATPGSVAGHHHDEMGIHRSHLLTNGVWNRSKAPGGCGKRHCQIEWKANRPSRFRISQPFSQRQRGERSYHDALRTWRPPGGTHGAGEHARGCASSIHDMHKCGDWRHQMILNDHTPSQVSQQSTHWSK